MEEDKKEIKPQDTKVEVSDSERQYSIQCEDIRLIKSSLEPINGEKAPDIVNSHLGFSIYALVDVDKVYSYLNVHLVHSVPGELKEVQGYELKFVYMASFTSTENIAPEEFGEFAKFYTLSLLWPYAREYVSDQLRRIGEDDFVLPIINPQVITKHLIENDLVKVKFLNETVQE